MQSEILVGLSGLFLVGAAAVRGSAALATLTFNHMRSAREDRRILRALRDRPDKTTDTDRSTGKPRLISAKNAPQSTSPPVGHELELVVAKRVVENAKGDICSFYLTAPDGRPLPAFAPGQFLTFQCNLPGTPALQSRCYSFSMHPAEPLTFYRVSVKRLLPDERSENQGAPGLISNFFHDHLFEGAVVRVSPPDGAFFLDQRSERPIVLIAGGIGITPLLSMLDWLAATQSQREVWVFYGVRNSFEHAFRHHFRLISETLPGVRQVVFYSQPTPHCQLAIDYHQAGHVNVEYMKHVLRAGDYEFYLCGPGAMMRSITSDLLQWGVPADAIKFEGFGQGEALPQTITVSSVSTAPPPELPKQKIKIQFARSKKSVVWTGRQNSLLELAEACGIKPRHSCRAGQCGTCKVGVRAGEVSYASQPAVALEDGACLPCVARPKTDLVLDL